MCGITGYCSFKQKYQKEVIETMTKTLRHRGPDAEGMYLHNDERYQLGLGHKRLSILDLTEGGKPPTHFEHLSIVFNGDVYNFREIKKLLVEAGYHFNSDSDTEVILKGYHHWGTGILDHLIGMFAFAL